MPVSRSPGNLPLHNTQKNTTNTESLVQQVSILSNQDTHKQVIAVIIADKDTDLEKKIDLIQKVNAEYDQREENNTRRVMSLQSTQTKNIREATSWWAENWCWLVLSGLTFIGVAIGKENCPMQYFDKNGKICSSN